MPRESTLYYDFTRRLSYKDLEFIAHKNGLDSEPCFVVQWGHSIQIPNPIYTIHFLSIPSYSDQKKVRAPIETHIQLNSGLGSSPPPFYGLLQWNLRQTQYG